MELATLVSATRTSAVLAAEAESRCARELATNAQIAEGETLGHRGVQDVPGWECPCVTNQMAYPGTRVCCVTKKIKEIPIGLLFLLAVDGECLYGEQVCDELSLVFDIAF